MNTLFIVIYLAAIIVAVVTALRSVRNRFLPMAVPVGAYAVLMIIACGFQLYRHLIVESSVENQFYWIYTIIVVTLAQLLIPIWVHCIAEYKYNIKIPLFRYRWLLLEPVVVYLAIVLNLPNVDWTSDLDPVSLIGPYYTFHFSYVVALFVCVLSWSVYTVSQKSRNSLYAAAQIFVFMGAPMVFFTLHRFGVVETEMGAPTMILLLLWAAKESSLLDVVPSATSGVLSRVNVGVLVFNAQMHLVFKNTFADKFLDKSTVGQSKRNLAGLDALPGALREPFDFNIGETQNAVVKLNQKSSERMRPSVATDLGCYVDATLSPISNSKTQQFLGQILLLQDVSERELSARSLARNNLQLAELNERKSNFFAGVSHEFRTPLTLSIGELTDTLNGDFGEVPSHFYPILNNVKDNNKRLLKLVGQLLELSRLNQGQAMFKPERINLTESLLMVVANFESLAVKQQVNINIDNKFQHSELWFDVNALENVLMNILSNAFKSIQRQGAVSITVAQNDDQLSLSVRDSGHGITPEVLPHIFDAFYYREEPNTRWPSGTGIGLHMVKQILEAHGASISVKSTVDIGTEFIVAFVLGKAHHDEMLRKFESPETLTRKDRAALDTLADVEKQPEIGGFQEGTQVNSQSRRKDTSGNSDSEKLVLIVEDNVQMRRYIRRHLGQEFRLIEAEDGEEGLALAQQSVPDLILTDLMMPKLNGLEFSQKIRQTESTSHIPIILLTAKSDAEDKLIGYRIGIDDYLTKPFDALELVARIHNLISSRHQLKQRFVQSAGSVSENESDSKIEKLVDKEVLFLQRFDTYVLENLELSDLRIHVIADHFHMSERSLHRKLNAVAGLSPKQYVMSLRMREAEKRLIATRDAVNTIALCVGFTDAAHFSRAFKTHNQLTPLEYRKQHSDS